MPAPTVTVLIHDRHFEILDGHTPLTTIPRYSISQRVQAGALAVDADLGCCGGGDDGTRTHDPLLAKQVLFQLSYIPVENPV